MQSLQALSIDESSDRDQPFGQSIQLFPYLPPGQFVQVADPGSLAI